MELDEDISMGDFNDHAYESILESQEVPDVKLEPNGHAASMDHNSFIQAYVDGLSDPNDDAESKTIVNGLEDSTHRLSLVEAGQEIAVESTETQTTTPDEDFSMSEEVLPSEIRNNKVEVVIRRAPDPVLPYSSSRTGLMYDARMRFHTELGSVADDDIHPEDPRRIWEIFQELAHNGLVETDTLPDNMSDITMYNPQRLLRIPARLAEREQICLVHTQEHYEFVESLNTLTEMELKKRAQGLDSVYLHPLTHYCARLSAGGAIEACRAAVGGSIKNAIAVIRPPGHHAEHDKPGGFCFFNNVCVAARVCQEDFPDLCRKVLILDWDVHHGNGIQNIFEDDPNVLYISIHVHKDGHFYPNGPNGGHKYVGTGAGIGKNINIPWPQHYMGDGDYLHAFQQIVMPCAQEFNPDLVIISAGFDAAEGDMLGQCLVTPAGFAHMTHMLMSLADGKVVACLEGGYNLRSIAKSALAVTRTLMGEPPGRLHNIEPSLAGVATVKTVISEHAKYWKCLYPKESLGVRLERQGGERLHDSLRKLQYFNWSDKFKMAELAVLISDIPSPTRDYLVVATPDYAEKKPLLVILHDPPETLGIYGYTATTLEPHNIITTDASEPFIQDAIAQGLAVIDINIPRHVTGKEELKLESGDINGTEVQRADANKIASYIWENYIEINPATHIFLLGIGSASSNLVNLISNHERTSDMVNFAFSFIGEQTVVGVNRHTDDYINSWYYTHSEVFVTESHPIWAPERQRKVRKRYGALTKVPERNLNDMMLNHRKKVFERIAREVADYVPDSVTSTTSKIIVNENPDTFDNGLAMVLDSNEDLLLDAPSASLDTRLPAGRLTPTASPGPLSSPVRTPQPGLLKVTQPK